MKLTIGHLYPDLLNLYGDRGNIQCLMRRCQWRGIEAETIAFELDDKIDFSKLDIVLLGGGSDREQMLVCEKLKEIQKDFKAYVEDNGVVIAICGGYQLLGNYYKTDQGMIEGLKLVDMSTEQGKGRLIGNIVMQSELFDMPIVGFENHGGRTTIGNNKPLGKVLSGYGNDGQSGAEGVVYKNVIGTYLHGPLLPKNPQLADLLISRALEKKYGKAEAAKRIFATTDRAKGALKGMCDREGYETFVIPDDVGGRFSVLTPVGLLPMAAAGVELDAVMQGAADAREKYSNPDLRENDCYQYAALRHLFYQQGKTVEILANYEPHLTSFGEWFKQLFAESEGKEHKGIFPVAANFSTDLHSIGQYIQDGLRCFFETVLWVKTPKSAAVVPFDAQDEDGLNFLAEKEIHFVNSKAFAGTMLAHMDGGVPNLVIELDKMDAYHFGALVYFFEKAVGISGYLLDVNPFDQPGVEAYKKNMFALLGKPGHEDRKAELEARL